MENKRLTLSKEEMEIALAAYKWILEKEQLTFHTFVSTLCAFTTRAGTLYAVSRLLETSCGAADCMTTDAVGMAISALSVVGSYTWMLNVSHRYRTLMKIKPARLDVPFVFKPLSSIRVFANMKKTILRLEEAILKCATTPRQNATEKLPESENAAPNQQKGVPDEA